jgi:hypothetical protein
MRYSFLINDDKGFCGCSTVYTVYDTFTNEEVAYLVLGYSSSHELFYVAEYGGRRDFYIESDIEFCAILNDFVQVFELMNLSDIFRSEKTQDKYEEHVPAISKDNLTIYASEGEIIRHNNEFIIVPSDCDYLKQLSCQGVFNNKQFFKEYCTGDEDVDDLFEDIDTLFDLDQEYQDGIYFIDINWSLVSELANKNNKKVVI